MKVPSIKPDSDSKVESNPIEIEIAKDPGLVRQELAKIIAEHSRLLRIVRAVGGNRFWGVKSDPNKPSIFDEYKDRE